MHLCPLKRGQAKEIRSSPCRAPRHFWRCVVSSFRRIRSLPQNIDRPPLATAGGGGARARRPDQSYRRSRQRGTHAPPCARPETGRPRKGHGCGMPASPRGAHFSARGESHEHGNLELLRECLVRRMVFGLRNKLVYRLLIPYFFCLVCGIELVDQ